MTEITDPTFCRTPADAIAAAPESLAYAAASDPRGNELHHFGWNACSGAPGHDGHGGHAGRLERRYLMVPGLRLSRTMKLIRNRCRGAMVLSVTAVMFGSVLAAAGPAAEAAVARQAVPFLGVFVPKPGTDSFLTGVFCTSARDCWAVGYYTKNVSGTGQVTLNQALHWNGLKWSRISTPNPGGIRGKDYSDLFATRCSSGTDCWAVGSYGKNGTELNQVLHWNGRRWSTVAAPTPGGTASHGFSSLQSVSCASATNCWAVGWHEKVAKGGARVILNQALRWNGRKWTGVAVPNPVGTATDDDSELNSVRCPSARDCWAVGFSGSDGVFTWFNQTLHWNGRRWSVFKVPSPGGAATGDFSILSGLSCTSATNCWAAGTYGNFGPMNMSTRLNQAQHWNGHTWSVVAAPEPDGTGQGASNQLDDVSCTSASNCWAVGRYGSIGDNGVGSVLNQALHWDGGLWSLVPTPDPAGTSDGDANNLNAVRCSSASNCWAVGDRVRSRGPDINQALRWNGRRWTKG